MISTPPGTIGVLGGFVSSLGPSLDTSGRNCSRIGRDQAVKCEPPAEIAGIVVANSGLTASRNRKASFMNDL